MSDAKLAVLDANQVIQYVDNEGVTTSEGAVLRQRVEAPESDAILSSILADLAGTLTVSDGTSHTSLAGILSAVGGTLTVSDSTSHATLSSILTALNSGTTHTDLQDIVTVLGTTLAVSDGTSHTSLASIVSFLGGTLTVSDSTSHTTLASILSALQGSLTITGTVAVTGVATASNQTGGSQKTQIVDASNNVIGSTSNALNVNITGGSTGTPTGPAGTPNTNVVTVQGISGATALPVSIAATVAVSNSTEHADLVNIENALNLVTVQGTPGGTAVPVSVSNTVPVTGAFYQATQPVSGAFYQATQPVSGAVTANAGTNTSTAALALETGGNLATLTTTAATLATSANLTSGSQKTQIVDGSNNVIGSTTNALDVYVSGGSVSTSDLTATGTISAHNTNPNSGSPTANSTVSITDMNGETTLAIQVEGSFTGLLTVQGRIDSTNWVNIDGILSVSSNTSVINIQSGVTGLFQADIAGFQDCRVAANSFFAGSAVITLRASTGPSPTAIVLSSALPSNAAQETGGNLASIANGLLNTASSDAPRFVALTGDPSGDFAGINLLEQVMTDGTGLNLNVNVQNQPLQDTKGALVPSDAKQILTGFLPVGANFIFDTTGYQSFSITTQALAGAIASSNDLITWNTLSGISASIANAFSTTVSASSGFIFPCLGRYVRIVPTTAGSGTIHLRNVTFIGGAYNSIPLNQNISQVGGTNVVNAGVAGVISVGGNVAIAGAATTNPTQTGGRVLTTLPTNLTTNGFVAANSYTSASQLIVRPFGSAENDWQATSGTTALTATTVTQLSGAGAASIRNYCTALQCVNTSITTATTVSIVDGASTVIWTGYLPAVATGTLPAPLVVVFPTPLKGSTATIMNIQLGGAANVYYNAQGYQSY